MVNEIELCLALTRLRKFSKNLSKVVSSLYFQPTLVIFMRIIGHHITIFYRECHSAKDEEGSLHFLFLERLFSALVASTVSQLSKSVAFFLMPFNIYTEYRWAA